MDRGGGDIRFTEDKVVNFILNNKISLARQKGIIVSANIDFPLNTNITSNDMTTILANLFDNAIESCDRGLQENDKHIDMVVRRINKMLFIKVENSCCSKPLMENNSLITRKHNRNLHGWGLKSIKRAAQKYDGSVDFVYIQEKQIFRTILNLSFDEFLKQ